MSAPEIMYEVTWEWPPAMVRHGDPGTRKALATRGAANELESALRDSGFVNVVVRPADGPVTGRMSIKNPPLTFVPKQHR